MLKHGYIVTEFSWWGMGRSYDPTRKCGASSDIRASNQDYRTWSSSPRLISCTLCECMPTSLSYSSKYRDTRHSIGYNLSFSLLPTLLMKIFWYVVRASWPVWNCDSPLMTNSAPTGAVRSSMSWTIIQIRWFPSRERLILPCSPFCGSWISTRWQDYKIRAILLQRVFVGAISKSFMCTYWGIHLSSGAPAEGPLQCTHEGPCIGDCTQIREKA